MYSRYFRLRGYLVFKLKIDELGVIPESSISLTADVQSISKYRFIFDIYLEFTTSPHLYCCSCKPKPLFISPRTTPVANQPASLPVSVLAP